MFCTNCGEEMRDTDKFCAACGTAAAPRAAKKRTDVEPQPAAAVAAPPNPAPPQPVRVARSTAEVFSTPIRPANAITSAGKPREESVPERTPEPARPAARPAETWNSPRSEEEQRRTLIEAEEIASARGMMPIEALPDPFPPPSKAVTRSVAATVTCPTCGKLNPDTNIFCESCGRKLDAVPSTAAETPPGWLYDAQPATAEPPAAAATPPTTSGISEVRPGTPVAISAPANSAVPASDVRADAFGSGGNFSYYYDDNAAKAGSKRLLYVLIGVLALGIVGVFYLMLRPSTKSPAAANVSVRISPDHAQVEPGNAFDFAATVTGSGNTDVDWSVQEGSAGGKVVNHGAQAQGGEVSNMAVYVAPATPGTYHVVAASKANPAKSASAEVLVEPK